MPASWKDDELTALTGRLKRVGPGASTVSSDAPNIVTDIAKVPLARMPGVYDAESIRKTSAPAVVITSGTLRESGVKLPERGTNLNSLGHTVTQIGADGKPLGTIAFVDTAHPSRRWRDASTVESAHQAALSENPRAFHITSGLASRYDHHGSTIQRYMLPMQRSQQRLTSLEDTLARMQLHGDKTTGGRVHDGIGVTAPSSTSDFGVSTRRAVSNYGPRFDGTRRPTDATNAHISNRETTSAWGRDETVPSDRSLQAALHWRPSTVPANEAEATLHAITSGNTLALPVPAPTPLLAAQTDSGTFLSRSSARGINPRLRATNIDVALETLVAERVGTAAAPDGGLLADRTKLGYGQGKFSAADGNIDIILGHSVGRSSARHGGVAGQDGILTVGTFNPVNTPMRLTTTSRSVSPAARTATAGSSTSGWESSEPQEQRHGVLRRTGTAGPSSLTPGIRQGQALPPVNIEEERKWIGLHPRDTMVTRMADGTELVKTGVLQARALARQDPHATLDLTHKFVDKGTWSTLNLAGNTASPIRRPLQPNPTRGAAAGDLGMGQTSPGFRAESAAYEDGRAGFAATGTTAFGGVQQERQPSGLAEAPGGDDALRKASQPLLHTAGFSAELGALDAFERERGINSNPANLPRKALISKIKASNLASEIGFADERALEVADRETLITALDRLPSAARRRALWGPTNRPRSDMSMFTVRVESMPGSSTIKLADEQFVPMDASGRQPPLSRRVDATQRGINNLQVGLETGSFHEQPYGAYSAGVAARVNPPSGRRMFDARQEDARGPPRPDMTMLPTVDSGGGLE